MADNFVTCRHCGIGINYACDHEDDDVPAEEVAALRLALAEAHARIADLENPDFVNCDGLHADGKYPNTPHRPIGINRLYPCPACTALSRARETDGAVREDVQRALVKLEEAARWHQATVGRRGTNNASEEDLLLAAHLMVEALSSPPRPETKAPRECGGRCHDAIDSRSPCPECAAEMHGPELVPRPAPPADAATEAAALVKRAYVAWQNGDCTCEPAYCAHLGPVRAALDALVSAPAPAPSAKETRT